MALNSAQSIFNLIRINGSDMYKNTVPALSESSPIGDVSTPILTQPVIFKEFTLLLGALLKVEALSRAWANPLSELIRKGGSPLGEFTAEVGTDFVNPKPYDATKPELLLVNAMTEDKVAYYVRNIKEVFEISIAYEDMQGAFNSYADFNDYVSMKLASLQSGQQISEFNHIFESIVVNYYAGLFKVSDVRAIPDNYAAWTVAVRNAIDGFRYPSTNYNNYGNLEGANGDYKAFTNLEDIYIIATFDWANNVDVNFLSAVFNLDKAEVAARIIRVPDFGYDVYEYDEDKNTSTFDRHVTTPIKAMVLDRRMLKLESDLEIDNSFFNERTLVTKYMKHWWAKYNCSPFANCLVFIDNSGDEIKLSGNAVDLNGTTHTATLTYTPTDADINIKFESAVGILGESLVTTVLTEAQTNTVLNVEKTADGTITFTLETDHTKWAEIFSNEDSVTAVYNINGNAVAIQLQLPAA